MIRNPFFPRLTWATNQPLGPSNEKRDSNPHGFPRHPLKMPLSDCD